MSKNKRPRKKYTPREVYSPNLVNQINAFQPIEEALDRLIETGVCLEDSNGDLVYQSANKVPISFKESLSVYITVIDVYASRNNLAIDTSPMGKLLNAFYEARDIDESLILETRQLLKICREIICKISALELRSITQVWKISRALEDVFQNDFTEPEFALETIKTRIGDLSYEEVVAKNEEFQALALKCPENNKIISIRNTYAKALSIYRAVKMKEVKKKFAVA